LELELKFEFDLKEQEMANNPQGFVVTG